MNLALICAMDEELTAILELLNFTYIKSFNKANNLYTQYSYNGHVITAVVCGIGKVNSAITTQIIIDSMAMDLLVNVGVAGALNHQFKFGDVVIASDLVQHDMDVSAFGVARGQIPRMGTFAFPAEVNLVNLLARQTLPNNQQIHVGRVVSGDQFINDATYAEFLHKEFNALACEMEGAAIGQVCYLNSLPFVVIRSISDMAGINDVSPASFIKLKDMAAVNSALVFQALLENL